jgi:hypothetical protein
MTTQPSPEDLARWHRWFAIECNNGAWPLADLARRTDAEQDEMLNAAHAAAWHWSHVCPDWEIAFSHAVMAHAAAAAGAHDLHISHYQAARAAGQLIKDAADNAIFDASFATIPTP